MQVVLLPVHIRGRPECDRNLQKGETTVTKQLHHRRVAATTMQRRLSEAGLEVIQLMCPQITALEEVVILQSCRRLLYVYYLCLRILRLGGS